MYDGYLKLGDVEILGTTRAVGYTQSGDCPIFWLDDEPCDTLAEALGDIEYTRDNITSAPWFDFDEPDLASRFLGISLVSIAGLDDSTAEASSTELPGSGARVTGLRDGGRQVRVRAMLTADGSDALDYGRTWLDSALRQRSCVLHRNTCGRGSLEYLSTCPPPRGALPEPGPWATTRTNYVPVPQVTGGAPWGGADIGAGTPTPVIVADTVPGADGSLAARTTWTTPTNTVSADIPGVYTSFVPVGSGQTLTFSADFASSATGPLTAYVQFFSDLYIPTAVVGEVPVTLSNDPTNPTRVIFENIDVDANSSYAAIFVGLVAQETMPAGFWISAARFYAGDSGDYFDGDSIAATDDDDIVQTIWSDEPNDSPSFYQTRRPIGDPYTDEEYAELQVDPLRRYLHSVVRVSGPLVERRIPSGDGRHWGMIVEYTLLAEKPNVYSVSRPAELGVSPSLIIQDIPFNLVTHPSAEISSGTVEIGRNYLTNPSLEQNATGWNAQLPLAPQAITSQGRSTDIASVGTYSYRARLLGSGIAPHAARVPSQVFIFAPSVNMADLPPRSRPSFSIWAAGLIYDGESPNTRITALTAAVEWTGTDGVGSTVVAATPVEVVGGVDGRTFSARSVDIPVVPGWTIVSARIVITADIVWSSTTGVQSDVRIYADAASVTVP